MTEERWTRVWDLFHRAADLPVADRAAMLEVECAGDSRLRLEVESLLAAHEAPVPVLDDVAGALAGAVGAGGVDHLTGMSIGSYRVGEVLGEGGMGTVYAAQQSDPIIRRVALKVVKAGMGTRQVVARFAAERQALAAMNHPNIAHIHDAGATPEGHPYFVMELVDGVPISEFCDARGLDVRQRLELLLPVCDAVQHAHHKGLVHRDLKPGNVLVTDARDGPQPKVIDFGIAKAIGSSDPGGPDLTFGQAAVGTPSYMSPEQVAGGPVDTRADVYALGALLYRLLTGVPPFELGDSGMAEVERVIRVETPPTPSARVASGAAPPASDSPARDALRRQLRGELDWIVMKALDKDPERRYPTPSALADDIRRFLRDEPVTAGPPSALYRARTFVRRHRLAVAAAAVVTLSLALGMAATAWMAVEAARARDHARVEAETAREVSSFLEQLLSAPDPSRPRGDAPARETKVVDVLDEAAVRLADDLERRPEVRATLHHTLGTTYMNLARYDEAEEQLGAALAMRRRVQGPDEPATLASAHALAALYSRQGRYEEALGLLEPTVEARTRVLGPDHPDTLASLGNLGELQVAAGRMEAAESLFRRVLAAYRDSVGEEDERTVAAMNNLAFVLARRDRPAEAERLYRRALEVNRRMLGDSHPNTVSALNNLAAALYARGALDEAADVYEEALRLSRRVHGDSSPSTLNVISNLGALLLRQGRTAEAVVQLRAAVEGSRALLGSAHPRTLLAVNNLARAVAIMGEDGEAEELYQQLFAVADEALPAGDPNLPLYRSGYGDFLTGLGRHVEAEAALLEALEGCREVYGDDHPRTTRVVERLVALYESWGRPDRAEPYRARLGPPAERHGG